MFNALNGLGGGGQLSSEVSDNSNSALYSTFAIVGFCSGSITNRLGIKTALSFGGIGYSVYVSAYLCYNHTENEGYVIFAGFLLGCCAGVLWSAQGQIMMSYPPEAAKGRYIFAFWAIFNLGGVIGGLVSMLDARRKVEVPADNLCRYHLDKITVSIPTERSMTALTSPFLSSHSWALVWLGHLSTLNM